MDILRIFIDVVLHLDQHLDWVIRTYGIWTYAILFIIIFCETGFVITPFLPGDSLLFASGTFVAIGSLDMGWLAGSLSLAAIAGDTLNYWIGHAMGPKVFTREDSRLLNREHLDRTHRFYQKYGGKTIILARFIPIIRTFAPFVAGVANMSYSKFASFNIFGGIVRCDRVAQGVVDAYRNIGEINIPIIVRLQGTNADEGKKIIDESGLKVHSAITLLEAAHLVTKVLN